MSDDGGPPAPDPNRVLTDLTTGLTAEQAAASLAEWGRNEITVEPTNMLKLFVMQFVGVMQLIL